MAFITVPVFLTFCLLVGVESAPVSLSSNQLTLNGNAYIQFYGPREAIWNGLSDGIKDLIWINFLDKSNHFVADSS